MKLDDFLDVLKTPEFSSSCFQYTMADINLSRNRTYLQKQINQTQVVFMDVDFLMQYVGTDDFMTGAPVFDDRVVPENSPYELANARVPLTFMQLATYVFKLVKRAMKTRPNATLFLFGAEIHTSMPDSIACFQMAHEYKSASAERANVFPRSFNCPFSQSPDALPVSVDASDYYGTFFASSVIGETFLTSGPDFQAALADRRTRPLVVSMVFALVFRMLEQDKDASKNGRTFHLMHPIFSTHSVESTLLPNVYSFADNGNMSSHVDTRTFDIGEVSAKWTWAMNTLGYSDGVQFEAWAHSASIVLSTLLVYTKKDQKKARILYFFGNHRVADILRMHDVSIPSLFLTVSGTTPNIPSRINLFCVACLAYYGTSSHSAFSGFRKSASVFLSVFTTLCNSVLAPLTTEEKKITTLKTALFFTVDTHGIISGEGNVSRPHVFKLLHIIFYLCVGKLPSGTLNYKSVVDFVRYRILGENDSPTNNSFHNFSDKEVSIHWLDYINTTKLSDHGQSSIHPVSVLANDVLTRVSGVEDKGFVDTRVKPVFHSMSTKAQLESFIFFVVSAFVKDGNGNFLKSIYEEDHPERVSLSDNKLYFFVGGNVVERAMNGLSIVVDVNDKKSLVCDLPTDAERSSQTYTAFRDFTSRKRLDALSTDVFFPCDVTRDGFNTRSEDIETTIKSYRVSSIREYVRDASIHLLKSTGLFCCLRRQILSSVTTDLDRHFSMCMTSLMSTDLIRMRFLTVYDRSWTRDFLSVLSKHARAHAANNSIKVYPNEQLIFRYIYSKAVIKPPVGFYGESFPFSCLIADNFIKVFIPTTCMTEMRGGVDVSNSSANLCEYVLGFSYPSEFSRVTLADFRRDCSDIISTMAIKGIDVTDFRVVHRTSVFGTRDVFYSGVQVSLECKNLSSDSFSKDELNYIARSMTDIVISECYANIAFRAAFFARIDQRFFASVVANIPDFDISASAGRGLLVRIPETLGEYVLSGSLYVCDYGIPLLRCPTYVSDDKQWVCMMSMLSRFREYIERAFFSFLEWKLSLSVYHRWCAIEGSPSAFYKVEKNMLIGDFFFPDNTGKSRPTLFQTQRASSTIIDSTYAATWPVSFLIMKGIRVSGDSAQDFTDRATACLREFSAVCLFLCEMLPSARNMFSAIKKTTGGYVISLVFVHWASHDVQHYLFYCFNRLLTGTGMDISAFMSDTDALNQQKDPLACVVSVDGKNVSLLFDIHYVGWTT